MQKKQTPSESEFITDNKGELATSGAHTCGDSQWIVTVLPMKVKTAPKVGTSLISDDSSDSDDSSSGSSDDTEERKR